MASKLNGERMIAGSEERWPMMVFLESCKYCQDYIPMIERNPDEGKMWDAQEDGEATHICDCVRLAAMAHKIVYDAPTDIDEEVKKAVLDKRTVRPALRDIIPGLEIG